MSEEEQPKPKVYRVTLKSGEYAEFPNRNGYEDYPSRLVSGIYGIMTRSGHTPITPQNVESIVELRDEDEPAAA